MTFEIVEIPSGGILIKGKLVQKKLTAKSKRLVMLCFPKSLEDIQVLFEHLTLTNKETGELDALSQDDQREASIKDMEIFGHVSLAAISGFPLLVIGTNARSYIHFSQIQGLYDEEDLGQACSFSILTSQSEFRFVSETSTGYQKWVGALTQAFESMSVNQQQETGEEVLDYPDSPEAAGSFISRPLSAMSKEPADYIEIHRTISANRAISRRSLSQCRQSIVRQDYSPQHQGYGSESMYGEYLPKKSIWGKVKNAFTSFKNKFNPEYMEDNDGVRGRALQDMQYDEELPPPVPLKTPRRRKSIAHYLGIEE